MDLKRYEKTRYQNIYRNKKNKNYMVRLSNPDTSISTFNGKRITSIDDAKKIRDNSILQMKKKIEIKGNFSLDELWEKYIFDCEYIKKQEYNTIIRKNKTYNKYLKKKFTQSITKFTKNMLVQYIDNLDTTIKQKNQVIKDLKTFFNWCVDSEYIHTSPMDKIKKYKVEKTEMKYWSPDEIKKFFTYINSCDDEVSYRIKMIVFIGFSLGDRIGETRSISFDRVDTVNNRIMLKYSINYNYKEENFVKTTKNKSSDRVIDVSPSFSNEIIKYKEYLKSKGYAVKDDNLIFLNYQTGKPYSDVILRKQFHECCDKAGVPRIRMYDLRHTYVATMMAEGKELYLISERLGHSSFATTVNKYGHLSNDVRKEVALATDKYM